VDNFGAEGRKGVLLKTSKNQNPLNKPYLEKVTIQAE
jgi:hypothetical protein